MEDHGHQRNWFQVLDLAPAEVAPVKAGQANANDLMMKPLQG